MTAAELPRTVRISFSPAMVNALIAGVKTETRRMAVQEHDDRPVREALWFSIAAGSPLHVREPIYREPEEIDARTGARMQELVCYRADGEAPEAPAYRYRHTADRTGSWGPNKVERAALSLPSGRIQWAHPRFMPLWAERLILTLEGVRREPLRAITDEGARAEGATERDGLWSMDWSGVGRFHKRMNRPLTVKDIGHRTAREAFVAYWNYLHSPKGTMTDEPWRRNPDLAVLSISVTRLPHPCWAEAA